MALLDCDHAFLHEIVDPGSARHPSGLGFINRLEDFTVDDDPGPFGLT